MAISAQDYNTSLPNPERSIVFNGEIHPYYIFHPKINNVQTDILWYIRDSRKNGLLYVDYICNEKISALGKCTSTWKYYSIPFGLLKDGWEMIDPHDQKQTKKIIKITATNSLQHIQNLLEKLEKTNVGLLPIMPEIPQLIRTPICDVEDEYVGFNFEKRLISAFRIHPTEKQASGFGSLFANCSIINLEKEMLRKAVRQEDGKNNFFLSLLKKCYKKFS